jgi:predicted metal-dependent enzyme (double-stranded beta helix superfamily)
LQALCDRQPSEAEWLGASEPIMRALVSRSDWLPDSHRASHPQFYQQHALHIDPRKRFSLSSFVWGPGQGTPIHNHTIAGWVGVLTGAEMCQRYEPDGLTAWGEESLLNPGDLGAVSPHDEAIGDIHTVRNAFDDRISISVHLYRGDISGTSRSVFKDGQEKAFISAYSSAAALI